MPKFVKKTIPIEAIEATGSDYLHTTFPNLRWRKTKLSGGQVYNELHKSWINFDFGDFLNITSDGDVYPIERKVFFATYDRVED